VEAEKRFRQVSVQVAMTEWMASETYMGVSGGIDLRLLLQLDAEPRHVVASFIRNNTAV
jgi:hypothetical protein